MDQPRLQDTKSVLALVGFTFLIWLGRVRNIILDDTLSGFNFAWSLGVAITFCALAAAALAANRGGRSVLPARILAVVSIGYWLIRGVQIALADHELAFIVVHSTLASVSVVLGLWVLYGQLRHAEPSTPT
jgi:hypothetical protein